MYYRDIERDEDERVRGSGGRRNNAYKGT